MPTVPGRDGGRKITGTQEFEPSLGNIVRLKKTKQNIDPRLICMLTGKEKYA